MRDWFAIFALITALLNSSSVAAMDFCEHRHQATVSGVIKAMEVGPSMLFLAEEEDVQIFWLTADQKGPCGVAAVELPLEQLPKNCRVAGTITSTGGVNWREMDSGKPYVFLDAETARCD